MVLKIPQVAKILDNTFKNIQKLQNYLKNYTNIQEMILPLRNHYTHYLLNPSTTIEEIVNAIYILNTIKS